MANTTAPPGQSRFAPFARALVHAVQLVQTVHGPCRPRPTTAHFLRCVLEPACTFAIHLVKQAQVLADDEKFKSQGRRAAELVDPGYSSWAFIGSPQDEI